MEEHPSASLFRPYVVTPEGPPSHSQHDSPTSVLPTVATPRPAPPTANREPAIGPATTGAGESVSASEPPARRSRHSGTAGNPPAMRPSHRTVFAAMAAVITLAIVVAARITATDSEPATADETGTEWFIPDAAGPVEAPSVVPAESGEDISGNLPGAGEPSGARGGGKAPVGTGRPAPKVNPTGAGSTPTAAPAPPDTPPQNATAYTVIQAETFAEQNGVKIETAPNGSGRHVGFITKGDWLRYDDVGFTDVPATKLRISAANWAKDDGTGVVEVRLDDRSAIPIGSMTIPNNHSWFDFVTYSMPIRPTTGVHTVYLTFTSTQREEFGNIDWIQFQH